MIDDDLGISASGTGAPASDALLRACTGQVGAVFSIDRMAGLQWPGVAYVAGILPCDRGLLIDADTVYDPSVTNDRPLLGMKGTISEMEVASFRERAEAALRQKAQRGELFQRGADRLRQDGGGSDRERSRCSRRDGHRADLSEVCGGGKRAAGLSVAGSAADPAARRARTR